MKKGRGECYVLWKYIRSLKIGSMYTKYGTYKWPGYVWVGHGEGRFSVLEIAMLGLSRIL
jgi:hypothetical protein